MDGHLYLLGEESMSSWHTEDVSEQLMDFVVLVVNQGQERGL
jgi:hypothetical protein